MVNLTLCFVDLAALHRLAAGQYEAESISIHLVLHIASGSATLTCKLGDIKLNQYFSLNLQYTLFASFLRCIKTNQEKTTTKIQGNLSSDPSIYLQIEAADKKKEV